MSLSNWKTRSLLLAPLLALAAAPAQMGCAADSQVSSGEDDITEVDHSAVKRQSIGNCWIYATSSWLEALHKAATNEELNTSESWLTYWDWFEKITETEMHLFNLERTVRFDKLGVNKTLLQLETSWDKRRLLAVTISASASTRRTPATSAAKAASR